MNFGFESGCLVLEKQAFSIIILQKSTFTEVGILTFPESTFHDFVRLLGPIFMIRALEAGSKCDDFSG